MFYQILVQYTYILPSTGNDLANFAKRLNQNPPGAPAELSILFGIQLFVNTEFRKSFLLSIVACHKQFKVQVPQEMRVNKISCKQMQKYLKKKWISKTRSIQTKTFSNSFSAKTELLSSKCCSGVKCSCQRLEAMWLI